MSSQLTVPKTKVITKVTESVKARGALFKSHGDPMPSNMEDLGLAQGFKFPDRTPKLR